MANPVRIGYVTRRETFSAAHRLHSGRLSEEENLATFGKCSGEHGHGHNYQVEVTVRGPIHPVTGMIINLARLKGAIWDLALDQLDHANLDLDVDFFAQHPRYTGGGSRLACSQGG